MEFLTKGNVLRFFFALRRFWGASIEKVAPLELLWIKNRESPRQITPKKGPKQKVHELRPFLCEFWCFSFSNWENKRDFRKSQKTRQSTVQAITGVQSWISPPPLTAPKHYKTSILGAVIVSERGFLEPPFFPERRVVGLLSFAHDSHRTFVPECAREKLMNLRWAKSPIANR